MDLVKRLLLAKATSVGALDAASLREVADVPLSKLSALRNVHPDPEKPPVHLILALRRGGVPTSMDSGLALPDFEPVSETVIRAWWTMCTSLLSTCWRTPRTFQLIIVHTRHS